MVSEKENFRYYHKGRGNERKKPIVFEAGMLEKNNENMNYRKEGNKEEWRSRPNFRKRRKRSGPREA